MKKILIIENRNTLRYENYYLAVEACGAEAVQPEMYGSVEIVKDMDGVIIPGGTDVDPVFYQEANTDSRDINDRLDRFQMDIIAEAVKHNKPILGICRGHQIINIFFGGTLIQNLDECDIHERQNDQDKVHMSRVEKDSFLDEIYHSDRISVNSAHHQAVKELGGGLKAVQFSDDGVIEAFCHTKLPIYCVQWHPERMCLNNARTDTVDGLKVFAYFINRC